MSKLSLLCVAVVLGSSILIPADSSSAGTAHPVVEQTRVLVAKRAAMNSHYWVRLRVRCVAPRGFTCEGEIWLSSATAKIAGIPIPIADPRDYKLGAGKMRFFALRLASYARLDRPPRRAGAVWIKARVTSMLAGDAERNVRLHWRGSHR